MRDIKFRLRKDGKIVGYEIWFDGHHSPIKPQWMYIHSNGKIYPHRQAYSDTVYIEHESKEQFTGLKDRNQKEIYESDVVKVLPDDVLSLRYAAFEVKFGTFGTYTGWNISREECEVIGDIYDNPELLKGAA